MDVRRGGCPCGRDLPLHGGALLFGGGGGIEIYRLFSSEFAAIYGGPPPTAMLSLDFLEALAAAGTPADHDHRPLPDEPSPLQGWVRGFPTPKPPPPWVVWPQPFPNDPPTEDVVGGGVIRPWTRGCRGLVMALLIPDPRFRGCYPGVPELAGRGLGWVGSWAVSRERLPRRGDRSTAPPPAGPWGRPGGAARHPLRPPGPQQPLRPGGRSVGRSRGERGKLQGTGPGGGDGRAGWFGKVHSSEGGALPLPLRIFLLKKRGFETPPIHRAGGVGSGAPLLLSSPLFPTLARGIYSISQPPPCSVS